MGLSIARGGILLFIGCCLVFSQTSCVSTEEVELPPHINLSPEELDLSRPGSPGEGKSPGDLGLSVEANESDSLERLEVLPGARVRSVKRGGPAALAGLEAGDVILSINGNEVGDRDGFEALAQRAKPGETMTLEVRRGTVVLVAKVTAGSLPEGTAPVELYRADPLKSRAGYRTVILNRGAESTLAAEVVKIFPGSSLPGGGLAVGDRITQLEGKPLASAQDLVRRFFEEHDFGDDVELSVLRGDEEKILEVTLWAPRRRISALKVPILFTYESSLKPDRSRFYFIDLFIISLFGYLRDEGEREIRFLSLIRFRTGYGELVEETPQTGEGP